MTPTVCELEVVVTVPIAQNYAIEAIVVSEAAEFFQRQPVLVHAYGLGKIGHWARDAEMGIHSAGSAFARASSRDELVHPEEQIVLPVQTPDALTDADARRALCSTSRPFGESVIIDRCPGSKCCST